MSNAQLSFVADFLVFLSLISLVFCISRLHKLIKSNRKLIKSTNEVIDEMWKLQRKFIYGELEKGEKDV